jgi:general secretion pathway protein D
MGASEVKLRDLIAIVFVASGLLQAQAPQGQPIPPLPGFGAPPVQAAPAPEPAPAPQPPAQQQPVQAAPPLVTPAPPTAPAAAVQTAAPAAAAPVRIGNLSLQNASLTEVINQLARQLHINYILDPSVKGNIFLNTYGDTSNMDARNLLELILRVNNAGMVLEGDIYRIVPLKQVSHLPIHLDQESKDIPSDDQVMLNLIFLKYVTVDELTKVLNEFTGENSNMFSYAPANLLFILDSRRSMQRTMDLISLFDSDTFANQRVRLFDVKNARPSDVQKDLENVLKAVSLDGKNTTVRFLPVDRINTLIAVAPNPGVFDTISEWLRKLDVPVQVSAGAIETHVYRVRYGRAECLAIALNQLFGSTSMGYGSGYGGGYGLGGMGGGYPTGGYGGGIALGNSPYNSGGSVGGINGASSTNPGGYGNANSFSSGFGGSGSCGGSTGMSGGGYGGGYGSGYGAGGYAAPGGAYGYPVFGGYSAQAPAATVALGQNPTAVAGASPVPGGAPALNPSAASNGQPAPLPVRIVPNPLDNALIIQAEAQQYQAIVKVLKDLDVPPRQILLEAKIYSVDLNGAFSSGVAANLKQTDGAFRTLLGTLSSAGTTLSAGALVGKSRELLATLNLTENRGRSHIISEPSLIATDSIPATLTVGSQIPVSTGSTTIPTGGGTTVTQSISSENTGVTLQVNARVNPSGVVTLIINQQVSTPGAGAGTLTPSFNQQVVQTQITVQDGDTIAIGGLIGETTTSGVTGIPLLDRIPYIGGIFGSKSYSHERNELIIFMTPHVIYDESGLIEASNELRDRVKKMKKLVKEL